MSKIKFPNKKITQHKYYCLDCEFKFYSTKAICIECKSTNVGIDEPILMSKKTRDKQK